MKEESYKAYIEEELSLRKRRKEIHRAPWRRWAAGDCVPWSSPCVTSRTRTDHWITEATSLVRCVVQYLRSLSPRKDCAVPQTQMPSVSKTLSHGTFLDLTTQTDAHDDAWEEETLVGTHEAHEVQAVVVRSGHNNLVQRHVLNLAWFHQVDLCEVMMKRQYKNTKRHMLHSHILRQVNRFHLTFLLLRLNLQNS